jgi:hypothetical protein
MSMDSKKFYELANLTQNPFRSNPTQEADPRMSIWVGYEKERHTLVKYLERTRADQVGNVNFVMIYGDYGTGKSHALLWSKHLVLEAKKSAFNSVVFYIQTLRKDNGKLSFAGALKEDIVGKSTLRNDVLSYKQFLGECVVEYKKDNGLGPEISTDTVLTKLLKSAELINFAREIMQCDNEEQVEALVVTKSDHQALVNLSRIINLFVFDVPLKSGLRRFKNGAYLLIDELDLLAEVSAKEAREANGWLRHIYDNCPNCFCLALAFTATAAELNVLFDPYVISRVSKQIHMDNLGMDDAKHFVKDILDTARIDSAGKKGYFPFAEDAVENIVSNIVSITPRKVIDAMQQILEEVRLLGWDPSKGEISTTYLNDNDVIADILNS